MLGGCAIRVCFSAVVHLHFCRFAFSGSLSNGGMGLGGVGVALCGGMELAVPTHFLHFGLSQALFQPRHGHGNGVGLQGLRGRPAPLDLLICL